MTSPLLFADLSHPLIARVRGVFADLLSAGLVDEVAWVDSADLSRLLIDSRSGTQRLRLGKWLSERTVSPRIVVVQGSGAWFGYERVSALEEAEQGLVEAATALVNVLIPEDPDARIPDTSVYLGRRNVIVSPHLASLPGAMRSGFDAQDPELPAHAAVVLSSIAGLWTGLSDALVDIEGFAAAHPSTVVDTAISYVRIADASAVAAGIRRGIIPEDGSLPRTPVARFVVGGGDARRAARTAADSLVAQHEELLSYAPHDEYRRRGSLGVDVRKAIAELFRFMVRGLLDPRAFLERKITEAKAKMARVATQKIYGGGESEYHVVVGGVSPDATRDTDAARDLEEAARSHLRAVGDQRPTAVSAGLLWRAVVSSGCALVDAGDVPEGVRLPVHPGPGTVTLEAEAVVPHPDTRPLQASVAFLDVLPDLTIDADDPYLALLADRALEELAQQPTAARFQQIYALRDELTAWMRERESFAWHVGDRIARELDKARRALAALLREDREPPRPDVDALRRIVERQQRIARGSFWSGLIILVLTITAVVLLPPFLPIVIGVAIAIGIVWLIASVVAFLDAQRLYYQHLNQFDDSAARATWLRESMASTSRQVARLASVYQQYRLWAGILATAVHDPFGGRRATVEDSALTASDLGPGLPPSLRVARAEFDQDRYRAIVAGVESRVIGKGWLADSAYARVAMALEVAGEQTAKAVGGDPWSDSELSDVGPLRTVVAWIGDERVRALATRRLDARIDQLSASETSDDDLLSDFAVERTPTGERSVTAVEFFGQLLDAIAFEDATTLSADGVGRPSPPTTSIIATTAHLPRAPRDGRVDLQLSGLTGSRAFDRIVVRTDVSGPRDPSDLRHFAP